MPKGEAVEIWFRTENSGERPIRRVEVERETAQFVYIGTSRTAKMSDYFSYFPTFKEAKKFLINQQLEKRDGAQKVANACSERIEELFVLTEKDATPL